MCLEAKGGGTENQGGRNKMCSEGPGEERRKVMPGSPRPVPSSLLSVWCGAFPKVAEGTLGAGGCSRAFGEAVGLEVQES